MLVFCYLLLDILNYYERLLENFGRKNIVALFLQFKVHIPERLWGKSPS